MRYRFKRLSAATGARTCVMGLAFFVATIALPTVCAAQEVPQEVLQDISRKAQRFSFTFEPDETVDMEFTAELAEDEVVRDDEFLKLIVFNGRMPVSSTEFNLSRLRLVRITAVRSGYGNAELFINRMSAGVVPIRRSRIYLQIQMLVNIPVRDFQTDQLTLIPSETKLKGLMTFIDRDGTRRTRTIVTSNITVPVATAK
jgi:hypothetical protein